MDNRNIVVDDEEAIAQEVDFSLNEDEVTAENNNYKAETLPNDDFEEDKKICIVEEEDKSLLTKDIFETEEANFVNDEIIDVVMEEMIENVSASHNSG